MLHVLALSALAVMLRHPELLSDDGDLMMGYMPAPPPALPTPLSKVDVEVMSPDFQMTLGRAPDHSQVQIPQNGQFYFRRNRGLNYSKLIFSCILNTLLLISVNLLARPNFLRC